MVPNPSQIYSLAMLVGRVASGAYRAATAGPKYRLYQALVKASKPLPNTETQQDKKAPKTQEQILAEFTEFLIKAQIYMNKEDYAMLEGMQESVYQMYLVKNGIAKVTLTDTDVRRINDCFIEAKKNYTDFCNVYDRLVSKGYEKNIQSITRDIKSTSSTSAKKAVRLSQTEYISLSVYREDLLDFLDPPDNIKINDDDKEANVEKEAVTSKLDRAPIEVTFKGNRLLIEPKHIRNKQKGDKLIAKTRQAKDLIGSNSPADVEYLRKLKYRYDACQKTILLYKKQEELNYFENNITSTLSNNPGLDREFNFGSAIEKSTMAIHMLVILSLVCNQDKITKEMSLQRIIALGSMSGAYGNNILSAFENAEPLEKLKELIRSKLNKTDADALIKTIDFMIQHYQATNTLHLKNKFSTIHKDYMAKVFNIPPDNSIEQKGKPALETVIEHCEAAATKKEYVIYMESALSSLEPYIKAELGDASTLDSARDRDTEEDEDFILVPASPQMTRILSNAKLNSPKKTAIHENGIFTLNQFSQTLGQRVADKTRDLGTVVQFTQGTKRFFTRKGEKKEFTTLYLKEATAMIQEDLIPSLLSDHKTKDQDKIINSKIASAEVLSDTLKRHDEEIDKIQSQLDKLDEEIAKLEKIKEDQDAKISEIIKPLDGETKKLYGISTEMTSDKINASIIGINGKIRNLTQDSKSQVLVKNLTAALMAITAIQKTIEEKEANKAKIKSLEDEHNTLETTLREGTEEADKISQKIDAISQEIDDYDSLPDPRDDIEMICNAMSDARKKSYDDNEKLSYGSDEADTQNKLFTEFYDALYAIPDEGPELAAHMLQHVHNTINKQHPEWPITINRTPNIQLTPPPSPTASLGSSSSSSRSGSSSSDKETGFASTLVQPNYTPPTLDEALLRERIKLLIEIEALIESKIKDKTANAKAALTKEQNGDEPSDDQVRSRIMTTDSKMKQLQDALDYLKGLNTSYANTPNAYYGTTAYDHIKQNNLPVGANKTTIENTFASKLTSLSFSRLTVPATDRTSALIARIEQHKKDIQNKHPEQSTNNTATRSSPL